MTSARAWSTVTPGLSRAVIHICRSLRLLRSHSPWPFICGAITIGTQTSSLRPGTLPRNSAGAIPTMVS